jgi:hypothetical protein
LIGIRWSIGNKSISHHLDYQCVHAPRPPLTPALVAGFFMRGRMVGMRNRLSVLVEISMVDSEFANRDELRTRNAVIEALDSCDFGEFIGAGSGLGGMDFSYWVDDEAKADKP